MGDDLFSRITSGNSPEEQLISTAVQGMVPKSEQHLVAGELAAMGSLQMDAAHGRNPRDILIESFNDRGSALSQKKAQLLLQMNEDRPMSKAQTAAMLLIGILPMLAGGAIKGSRGLSKGAEAGALGTQLMSKGFEAENERKDRRVKAEYDVVSEELKDVNRQKFDLVRDEARATDTATQKQLDREQSGRNASTRAAGTAAMGKAIGVELRNAATSMRNQELAAQGKSRDRGHVVNGIPYATFGRVDAKDADVAQKAAVLYQSIEDKISKIQAISKSGELPAGSRTVGKTGDDVNKLRTMIVQDIKDLKHIKGTMAGGSLENLEKLLKDPSSVWNNITGALNPFEAGIEDQLQNTKELFRDDFKNMLEGMNYSPVGVGDKITLKDDRVVTITEITPDGRIKVE